MLNIPIPSIFVSQNDEGVWDVIDGVQRLSTIFQYSSPPIGLPLFYSPTRGMQARSTSISALSALSY